MCVSGAYVCVIHCVCHCTLSQACVSHKRVCVTSMCQEHVCVSLCMCVMSAHVCVMRCALMHGCLRGFWLPKPQRSPAILQC